MKRAIKSTNQRASRNRNSTAKQRKFSWLVRPAQPKPHDREQGFISGNCD